ncbi:MAG TPA: orotate phosphoribosyltransferase [Spirochaetota bacterium]|nr:orotate phosphoribosyltransferase [Spirochaetota bacterium]
MNLLEKSLFETNAIRVANESKPFWYTSGTIGPYFINTHFLYGGESAANELLNFIDNNLSEPLLLSKKLWDKTIEFYNSNQLYKNIMDCFYEQIKDNINFKNSTFISGGERRDWFFSIVLAYLSKKEHLFIFKDLSVYSINSKIENINNGKVTHIADLITQASSYERAWIPAINNINGELIFSASVVDRNQGGKEFLLSNKIQSFSSVLIGEPFFKTARDNNVINEKQYRQIIDFTNQPDDYGRDFLINNIDFFKESLNSSDKSISSKAKRCLDENPYKINFGNFNIF